MIRTALILAAGRGERLRPLTDRCPKPLLPVQGVPLIGHHLQRLQTAGIERVIINHAHLGDQIRRYVNALSLPFDVLYSPEPPGGLEAGGGVLHALPLIGDQPFLLMSADILTDYPFESFTLPVDSAGHLVLIPSSTHHTPADFGLGDDQRLLETSREYTFAAIAAFHPQHFAERQTRRLRFRTLIQPLLDAHALTGEVFHGRHLDVGTMAIWNDLNTSAAV